MPLEVWNNIRDDAVGEFLQIERAGVGDVLARADSRWRAMSETGWVVRLAGKIQGQSGAVCKIDPLIVLEPGIGGLLAAFQQG